MDKVSIQHIPNPAAQTVFGAVREFYLHTFIMDRKCRGPADAGATPGWFEGDSGNAGAFATYLDLRKQLMTAV